MACRLPNGIILKNYLELAKTYKKGICREMKLKDIIEELIAQYLTDEYELGVLGFEWKAKEQDIIVKKIKWDF